MPVTDEPPDVSVRDGTIAVFVPGRLSAEAARRLASDLVAAALAVERAARAAAMGWTPRDVGPREGTRHRTPDRRSTRGALR